MDGAVFLICLLFGLRCSSIGADRLLGGDRIGEGTTTSWRVLANEYLLDLPLPVSVPSMSHCCLALACGDCQETRCYCLKNILQLSSFYALQFPAIMKPPKQHRMKTNMGKYAMKKVFNLLKIYLWGKMHEKTV